MSNLITDDEIGQLHLTNKIELQKKARGIGVPKEIDLEKKTQVCTKNKASRDIPLL